MRRLRASEALRRLQQVTDVALSHLELQELLDELLGRVVEVLPVDTAAIMLLEDDRNLVVRAARGIDEEVWRAVETSHDVDFANSAGAFDLNPNNFVRIFG